jgi:hypothetical protein
VDKRKYPVEPGTEEWEIRAGRFLRSIYHVYACKKCGAPVLDGYCCTYCYSSTPYKEEE